MLELDKNRSFYQSKVYQSEQIVEQPRLTHLTGETFARGLANFLKIDRQYADPETISGSVTVDRTISIEEFNRRYSNQRQSLALRKIRGESMSSSETLLLAELNNQLRSLMKSEQADPQTEILKRFVEKYQD